jgi:ABC-type uncharacterized transport system permease subunit
MLEAIVLTVITAATPLLLAALGELVVERAGVLNLGVEGMMVMGAVAGFAVALTTGSPALGMVAGAAGTGLAAVAAAVDSWPLFAVATVLVGFGLALAYIGTLAAVNAAAPEDRRAEVVSGYYLAVYFGFSVPVVGVGFAADAVGSGPTIAAVAALTAASGLAVAATRFDIAGDDGCYRQLPLGRYEPTP